MQGINKATIEAVSIKDVKTGEHGDFWPYGIKINGEWWNGLLSSQQQVDGMLAKKGGEVELFFYVDEKYGNKVRFVTKKDRKEAPKEPKEPLESFTVPPTSDLFKRIEALEERMAVYDKLIAKIGTPITDQVNQDAEVPIDTTDDSGDADDLEEQPLPF